MKISVIMASYLGDYTAGPHKSATNREYKFIRAVESFLANTHIDKELIIVSDGCDITDNLYAANYSKHKNIIFLRLDKQKPFSGKVRQAGLNAATGAVVCYLDSDDMLGPRHLDIINTEFDRVCDWCYYDDYLFDGKTREVREVKPEQCFIGTSSFAHRRGLNLQWKDGYGHDWHTIAAILQYPHRKIATPEYLVCHCTGLNLDY